MTEICECGHERKWHPMKKIFSGHCLKDDCSCLNFKPRTLGKVNQPYFNERLLMGARKAQKGCGKKTKIKINTSWGGEGEVEIPCGDIFNGIQGFCKSCSRSKDGKLMRIKFGDLKIDVRARKNIKEALDSDWINQGSKVKQLEEEWGKLFNYKHNVAMNNGTSANISCCLSLYDFGAKRGDEIIAPALAFVSVGNSILASGFKPVFVDIERETLNIDPKKIEEKITPRTKAIMVVHTMGKPCEMNSIMEIAKRRGLYVIEDSCEAHGSMYKDKFVGQFGDMATFSFYAAHLVCCGEGGMVSTNNDKIVNVLKSIKNNGRKPEDKFFDHVRQGLNLRMNDLNASIGIPHIEDFWKIFNKRKENLYYLLEKTKDLRDFALFNLEEEHEIVCPHAFSITLKNPKYNIKKLYDFFDKNLISAKRNFGSMPTQHKAFEFMGHELGEFPEAEYVGNNGLHIGIHQYLTRDHLDYLSDKIHEYFEQFKKLNVNNSQTR